MTTRLLILSFFVLVGASGGCATAFKGFGQDVNFTSTPPGAKVYVEGTYVGKTPVKARVGHGSDKRVEATLDGYVPKQGTVTTSFSGYSLFLLWFSLLGDLMTGSLWTVDNDSLHFRLEPTPSNLIANLQVPLKSKHLAVLEFRGKLEQDTLRAFADEVRGGAFDAVKDYGVDIMTRENMLSTLKSMGKGECTEGDCEVETGRNIGADFVVTGNVTRIGEVYSLTLMLHETQRGTLLGQESAEGATPIDLKRVLRDMGRKLVATLLGKP